MDIANMGREGAWDREAFDDNLAVGDSKGMDENGKELEDVARNSCWGWIWDVWNQWEDRLD